MLIQEHEAEGITVWAVLPFNFCYWKNTLDEWIEESFFLRRAMMYFYRCTIRSLV